MKTRRICAIALHSLAASKQVSLKYWPYRVGRTAISVAHQRTLVCGVGGANNSNRAGKTRNKFTPGRVHRFAT